MVKSFEIFLVHNIRTMATNFCPCQGVYVLNQFPCIVMHGMKGFHVSASGAIQGHHGPLVLFCVCIVIYAVHNCFCYMHGSVGSYGHDNSVLSTQKFHRPTSKKVTN